MHAESTVGWGTAFPEGISLARFRDNVFGFCLADEAHYWLPKIKQFLENLCNLPLTYETMGNSVTFLDCQVTISGTDIQWGLKNKKLLSMLSEAPQVQRYPHRYDPGAERTVKGLATNLGGKAVAIASTGGKVQENFAHIVWDFQHAGYPTDWWKPVLRNAYKNSAFLDLIPWSELCVRLEWECPVPPGFVHISTTPLPRLRLTDQLPSQVFIGEHLGPLTTVKEYVNLHPQLPPQPPLPQASTQNTTEPPVRSKKRTRAHVPARVTRSMARAVGVTVGTIHALQEEGPAAHVPLPPGADAIHPQVSNIVGDTVAQYDLEPQVNQPASKRVRISNPGMSSTARPSAPAGGPM